MQRKAGESILSNPILSLPLDLPGWIPEFLKQYTTDSLASPENRMQLTVDLAARNIAEKTGAPHATTIFIPDNNGFKLIALGVNVTIPASDPTAHAEVIALRMAGLVLGSRVLKTDERPAIELVCSSEPCGMCINAINLAKISSLLIAASDEDLAAADYGIGFKPADALDRLQKSGVQIQKGLLKDQAIAILKKYRQKT